MVGGASFVGATVDAPRHRPWLSRMWDGKHAHANESQFGVPGSLANISGHVQVMQAGDGCINASVGPHAQDVTVKVVCTTDVNKIVYLDGGQ